MSTYYGLDMEQCPVELVEDYYKT